MGLLGSASQGGVRFLYSVLIGRILGLAVLNTVNSAISVALLLSLLWPTSSGQAATRFVAQMRGAGRPDQASAVANYLGRRMLGTAVVLALAAVGFCLGILHTDLWTALCTGLLLLGYAGWSFARGVQYGANQIARAAAWDIAGSVFSVGMLLLVLLLRWEPVVLLPLALGYGIYAIICWPKPSAVPVDQTLVGDMNRFVGYGVLGTLSSTGLLQLSMIAAHLAGSAIQAGLYATALSLATPATMLARTLSQVIFPIMAEAGGRGDARGLRGQTDTMTRGLIVVMVPIFGALSLASDAVLYICYGERFLGARYLLPILLMAVMFTTMPIASVNRLNSVGVKGARFVSGTAAAGLLLSVALWLILIPGLGVMGIAVGYLVSSAAVAAVLIGLSWRLDKQSWSGLFLRLFAGLCLLTAGLWYLFTASPPPWLGVALALVFLLLWAGINWRDVRGLKTRSRGTAPAEETKA
ncbi:lipopolysaccharide biosynthesis protein [Paenarthrobacter sp. Z7-10]|uniref:lipopolysaccharide biosynthesis protein n=1 Tax=Paenarthrobacter sp. Z7-10 TaxID=2787635 RepID=UPI0022A9EAC1|nr:lipopolysaccharide biosynthesis protein [Paenarthrobacter sp. Z7-10]MCZ2403925.1 lipopolysaccharide biosynthesis protein [Paenarthrobacter sp. Z7-10]